MITRTTLHQPLVMLLITSLLIAALFNLTRIRISSNELINQKLGHRISLTVRLRHDSLLKAPVMGQYWRPLLKNQLGKLISCPEKNKSGFISNYLEITE